MRNFWRKLEFWLHFRLWPTVCVGEGVLAVDDIRFKKCTDYTDPKRAQIYEVWRPGITDLPGYTRRRRGLRNYLQRPLIAQIRGRADLRKVVFK